MSYNQSFGQQQQGGPNQQGQYGMRPPIQRSDSNSSLASIQPFPPNTTQIQGNTGFNPNHLQQLSNFHGQPQQQQGMYNVQQQQLQPGAFGGALGNGSNLNYQNSNAVYGNAQPQSNFAPQPTFAQQQQTQQQQNMARLQQQYMQTARQVQPSQQQQQQQQQQRQQPSPNPPSLPHPNLAAANGSFQRPSIPSNQSFPHPNHQPIPMPMQRTFSNQSNGQSSGAGPVQQAQVRPQLPISGYQPQFQPQMGQNRPSFSTPPANSLAPPMPLNQSNDPSISRPMPAPPSSVNPAPASSSAAAAVAADAPPKKKRRKPANQGNKNEGKPTPVVFFTGIDKIAREEPTLAPTRAAVPPARTPAPAHNNGHVQSNAPAPVERRRMGNVDGMRGTMRTEIARLMYAAGDVMVPDVDSVNYIEDLVVEFISDLCRPSPPIRSHPGAIHVVQPINPAHVRHRLSNNSKPSLAKYAARLDYMIAINEDIDRLQREAEGPSHEDLANTAGKEYLGIGNDGAAGEGQGGGEGGVRTGKRGRPKKGETGAGERRKPGPKKGWKTAPAGEGRKRGPYKKRNREGSGMMTPKGE